MTDFERGALFMQRAIVQWHTDKAADFTAAARSWARQGVDRTTTRAIRQVARHHTAAAEALQAIRVADVKTV